MKNKTNPFKKIANNASSTTKKWDDNRSDSSISTKTCPQCGAPRPVNTNISYCSYCRYNFMSVDINIIRHHE